MVNKTGVMLKKLREDRRVTLQEVADAIGCSPSYLHRLENSTRKNPSMTMIQSLAEFYEIEIVDILGIDRSVLPEALAGIEFRETIATEINDAIENMKEGLDLIVSDGKQSKQKFIEVQKNLLYVQSLL